ncbi:MAG: MFS transporter [Candidatus Obscuribacterales bacterium]|nr:MFS transporter [Candidatus Obscuribacterales bacterium]
MSEKKPSIYIPTLYLAEGLPYTIVNSMSVVFFKNLGLTNELIGLTSWFQLPWVIKFLWGPFVDLVSSKRNWIVRCHLILAVLCGLLAAGTLIPQALWVAAVVFIAIGFASATQDIAIDGFYMDSLPLSKQAAYVGIRGAAYKVAMLLGAGGLVYLAGKLGESLGIANGWSITYGVCAVLFLLLALFHAFYLPHPTSATTSGLSAKVFLKVFHTYFQQPSIVAIVLYILTFRLGDAFMLKMAQPFLLDAIDKGGLGISTADVGIIYGTIGTLFLLAGGILGGFIVSRDGLKKWLWPTALIQNSAILLYWLLSLYKPGLVLVAAVNAVEQFSYGLGVSAYTVFLLTTVKSESKAAHYAIATALMALGVMLPGTISGYLVTWLGYTNFFLLSFCAAIPGIITIFFLPLSKIPDTQTQSAEGESHGIQEVREVGPPC